MSKPPFVFGLDILLGEKMPNENCICSQQVHQIVQQLAGPVDLTPANKGQVQFTRRTRSPIRPNVCGWVGQDIPEEVCDIEFSPNIIAVEA